MLLSGVIHSALFGLPWPQKSPTQESEIIADETLPPDSTSGISTATLPASYFQQTDPVENEPPAAVDESAQVLAALESQPPQPAPIQQQPTLPTNPLPESQPPLQQTQQSIQENDPSEEFIDSQDQEDPLTPSDTESTENLPDDDSATKALLSDNVEYGAVVALDETFPHLAGAESGCYGLTGCQRLRGNFRTSAQQLVDQMEAKGYQLSERNDIENTGHRVFEVIVPDEPETTYFLNAFSPDIGITVYVMSIRILSLVELQQLTS